MEVLGGGYEDFMPSCFFFLQAEIYLQLSVSGVGDSTHLEDMNWECVEELVRNQDSVLGRTARYFSDRIIPMKLDRPIMR